MSLKSENHEYVYKNRPIQRIAWAYRSDFFYPYFIIYFYCALFSDIKGSLKITLHEVTIRAGVTKVIQRAS